MFQGMFRKGGRPPEPPLQIGGYENSSQEEEIHIPAHELRDLPFSHKQRHQVLSETTENT